MQLFIVVSRVPALRGHGDEKASSNIWNLIKLIGRYNEDIMKYILSEESTKFLSPQIQNEIIKTIGNHIIRQLIARIKTSSIGVNKFFDPNCSKYVYSIIADETSDISCKEQLSICIRYCTNTLESDGSVFGLL